MPIHDWSKAEPVVFHNLQLGWAVELSRRLNHGVLPTDHFAVKEVIDLRPAMRFREWTEPKRDRTKKAVEPGRSRELDDTGPLPLAEMFDPRRQFACRTITIRHADHHQAVAAIVWVTGQDKATPYRLRGLVDTAVAALTHGIHLLVIDLFPPQPLGTDGFHQLLARELGDAAADVPANRPLAVVSYRSYGGVDAVVEPLAVGDPLPEMPLFLSPGIYVPCPLEESYQATWDALPVELRESAT